MSLVRCPSHGRVYDSEKDRGCPLCKAGVPGTQGPKTKAPRSPEEAQQQGRLLLLTVLLVIVVIGAGAWFFFGRNTAEQEAQQARDSLRALAAGPRGPDTTKFAAANDLSPIRRSRSLKASLEGILASRGPLMNFTAGPIDTTVTDRNEKKRVAAYRAFAKRWHDRLDAATRNGTDFRYAPGVQYGPQMENVTNQLQAALSVMRDMVRPDEVKSRTDRVDDAKAAAGYLHAAGTVLTNLPR